MNQFKARIAACDEKMKEHAAAYKAIIDKAKEEDRETTQEDRDEIAGHTQAIEVLKGEKAETEANLKTYEDMERMSKDLGPQFSDFGRDVQVQEKTEAQVKSLGDQFIESKGYKALLEGGMGGQSWTTGAVELDTKAVLYESPGTALTPREYQPGIVQTLFQRNYVSDAFAQVTTNASQITYITESTATNAAAAVAEGTAKPQSTLAFSETTESVRKVATILPVSDEMLADAPQVQAYVNSRLVLFIKNTEESQVLTGSGTAPNIAGVISNVTGRTIGTFTRSAGTSNERALFMALNGTRGSSQLDPNLIVVHPTNWQTMRLGTDTAGQYFGGGPFGFSYGGPRGDGSASQFSADMIWNVPVVVTSNIPLGTALVGNFAQGGAVYRREGVTVEATNSHSTWFADDIVAIRAESRLALAIYRPSAFTAVIGLN